MAEIIELGGRKFRAIENSTIEHDLTAMRMLAEAGLDKVAQRAGESYDDFAVRVLSQVISSGKAFDLIGTFIIDAEKPDSEWTPESAQKIARGISKLTSPSDKLQVRNLVVTLLVGFSQAGLLSFATSRTSSTEEAVAARPEENPKPWIDLPPGVSLSAVSETSIQPGIWRSAGAHLRKVFSHIRNTSKKEQGTSTS
jgi:hypothetical protein